MPVSWVELARLFTDGIEWARWTTFVVWRSLLNEGVATDRAFFARALSRVVLTHSAISSRKQHQGRVDLELFLGLFVEQI